MGKNKLYILLPLFNTDTSVRECVNSVLAQRIPDVELILIDKTKEKKIIEDARVRFFEDESTFLEGYTESVTDDWILLLDSNKILHSGSLQIIYNKLLSIKNAKAVLVESRCEKRANVLEISKVELREVSAYDFIDDEVLLNSVVAVKNIFSLISDFSFSDYCNYFIWRIRLAFRLFIIKSYIGKLEMYSFCQCISYADKLLESCELVRLKTDVLDWIKKCESLVKSNFVPAPLTGNQLTTCISFLNEGEEIVNTVKSIRDTVGNAVDIVVVNDASTDGYDYEHALKPFNVYYVVNKYRIGSSAGKDKAIQICSTPYFILLDAHMRFYDSNWVLKIVRELGQNSMQLLCCQTKVLIKDDAGGIVDKGLMGVHGAYLDFDDGDYLPRIRWNGHLLSNKLKKQEIPVVLGATYCSSKQYWEKLRGFQGLCQYGAEEEYISVKAWLEGGGCKFLPDIIVGHIYRKKSPYKTYTLQMMYNRFVGTYTMFPLAEYLYAITIAKKENPTVYREVSFLLEQYNTQLAELKSYYKTFFHGHDFQFVKQINRPLEKNKKALALSEQGRLKKIIEQICNEITHTCSLSFYSGRIGQILVLALYANTFNDGNVDNVASDSFSKFLEDLAMSDMPYGFHNGYAGVGWVLLYLYKCELIDDPLAEELNYIDSRLSELNVSKLIDKSFENGIGGILAYMVERCFSDSCTTFKFDDDFLDAVLETCKFVVDNPDKYDKRTIWYALLFICNYTRQDVYKPLISINSVMTLPQFLPKDLCFQSNNMAGKYGYALNLITTNIDIKEYHSIF